MARYARPCAPPSPAQSQLVRRGVAAVAAVFVSAFCVGVFAVCSAVVVVAFRSSFGCRSFGFVSRSAAARFLWRVRAARRWWWSSARPSSSVVPSSAVPVGCLRWLVAPRFGAAARFWLSVSCSGGFSAGRRFWCRALSSRRRRFGR